MAGQTPHTKEELDALRSLTSPTVCNAIETFKARPRSEGFMGPELKCMFPKLGPMVGYAATAVVRASLPPADPPRVKITDVWEHVASVPEPRILVIQDMDWPRSKGSFWGEVNANIMKALGCVGTITHGGVRDLDEVEALGFHFFAAELLVSHAYIHVVDFGGPVRVGGLTVKPGDLLHGDQHGVTNVPYELAASVPEAARKVEERERRIISYCQSSEFTREGLRDVFRGA